MPRVIIENSGDVRLSRGHFKSFTASPDALVVSEREAQAIVTKGLGKIVERTDKAIPRTNAPRKPRKAAAEPVKPESEGDAG